MTPSITSKIKAKKMLDHCNGDKASAIAVARENLAIHQTEKIKEGVRFWKEVLYNLESAE